VGFRGLWGNYDDGPNMLPSDNLFFEPLIQGYFDTPRFMRRDWLAAALDVKLAEPGKRFVLLNAEPGAGKSSFLAQFAHDHSDWLRYFIPRDQQDVFADVSDKSILPRIDKPNSESSTGTRSRNRRLRNSSPVSTSNYALGMRQVREIGSARKNCAGAAAAFCNHLNDPRTNLPRKRGARTSRFAWTRS